MRQLLHWYVYGQWHISVCAVLLYVGGIAICGQDVSLLTATHIFTATLFIYTFHRFVSGDQMNLSDQLRYAFAVDHNVYSRIILAASGLTAGITFFFLSLPVKSLLVISGLISIGYVLPLLFSKRLRDIGMLKIVLIATVWGVIPIIATITDLPRSSSLLLFLEHFFFIFALTIPFDIRDRSLDARAKVSNLANTLSSAALRNLLVICIGLSMGMAGALYIRGIYRRPTLIILVCFYAVQAYTTIDFKKKRSQWYYLLWLDGFIFLKGLIYVLS